VRKQKLSKEGAKAKAVRDVKISSTPERRAKNAESKRKRRAAIKEGKDIKWLDYDHKDSKFKSVKANRGNDGNGTKKEGNKKTKK
jgi:hypothetical protein